MASYLIKMNAKKIIFLLFALLVMVNISHSLYVDCGFRLFDGTSTVSVLCEQTTITSSLRIYNTGTLYGLSLVDTTNPFATNLRVYTSSGVKAFQRTYCEGTDDSGCGTIDCSGYYLQSGTESPNATETCYNKADITTDRCENFADCKDANTADCSSQSTDVLQYTCGSCKYISASSCTGTTLGSCSNYASGVNCLGICTQCDGSGSCANQVAGQDVHSDCGGVDCDGGATKYYYGWDGGNTCYYMADESAAAHTCEGDGTCYDAADVCPANGKGVSTGVTRTTCKAKNGCTGTTAGSLTNVAAGLDTYGDCNGVSCSGYYVQTGTEGAATTEYCYDRADEPGSTHNCEGDGTCYDAADVCPSNAADTLKYSCGTCEYISASSCTGTTLGSCSYYSFGTNCANICTKCDGGGSCVNQLSNEDLHSDCGGISCAAQYKATGTESPTGTQYCYNLQDETAANHLCDGSGACDDAVMACYDNSIKTLQYSCGVCKKIETALGRCSGGTLGSCSNYFLGTNCGGSNRCASDGVCTSVLASFKSTGTTCTTFCGWASKTCAFLAYNPINNGDYTGNALGCSSTEPGYCFCYS